MASSFEVARSVARVLDPDDGDSDTAVTLAGIAVDAVTLLARAYTRGEGFDGDQPNDEIQAAILTASCRLARNPGGLSYSESMGPFAQDVRGAFAGFTLAELAALDRYRVHAL